MLTLCRTTISTSDLISFVRAGAPSSTYLSKGVCSLLRAHRTRRLAPPRERRHRSDHSEAVPQADRAHRVRALAVLRLALPARRVAQSRLRAESARGRGRDRFSSPAPTSGAAVSREHAPWALAEYGFRVIIAPSFADIFYNNCCQNGLLPVVLAEPQVQVLARRAEAAGYTLTVDLVEQRVRDGDGFDSGFGMDEYRRDMLLRGLDEIGKTLLNEPSIAAFERRREASCAEPAHEPLCDRGPAGRRYRPRGDPGGGAGAAGRRGRPRADARDARRTL